MNYFLQIKHINFHHILKGGYTNYLRLPSPSSRKISNVRRTSPLKEKRLKEQDKIPDEYTIIYKAPMESYLKAAKTISTISACGIGGLLLYKYSFDQSLLQSTTDDINSLGLVTKETDLIYFTIGFIAISLALRIMISKYPLRMYRNQEKYIAVFEPQIPFVLNKQEFIKGEVSEAKTFFLNPWKECMYRLRDKNAILLEDYFKTPSEFHDLFIK